MLKTKVTSVLIVGSGAIKIGEAGEFDYSTSQAIKALKEEGVRTIVVNPNIATVHTDDRFVDKIYFAPIRPEYLEDIIAKERPDGILLGFGGQTALNCGVELAEQGILDKYHVAVLGTGIKSIETADNRELFKRAMIENGVPVPKSAKATNVDEALQVAQEIGFPVIVRVAYTLGGQGSGVAWNARELSDIALRGLAQSRINQVLVEEYLAKWKEIEYEVMRDSADNCTIVCNMENLDPMGVHTGDSIVVAPSQTLTNREYNLLRETGQKVIRALGIVGECNIQFAVNPSGEEFRVIEVNSRLSRSSALASKATGYPIAYIAAKLSLGYRLPELMNRITGVTTACFEPSLDYVVVKIPRWDFQKFRRASRGIGTQMRSVGEVMAVGRCFEEALQKAVRMLDIGRELTQVGDLPEGLGRARREMRAPTDLRLFYIIRALKARISIEEIARQSGIDPWFLDKMQNIVTFETHLKRCKLDLPQLRRAKEIGFSDKRIGELTGKNELTIRALRKTLGVVPSVKQIDSLAAEWPAATNYLYLTYGGRDDDIATLTNNKVIVLGSGCYRIGSSVEFDWCCVNMTSALKPFFEEVLMINCNPETVSTDFDLPDRLYFEELTLERVLDIVDKEKPSGIVVSVGGQIPNNLALSLAPYVQILGTSPASIDAAEDRSKFSDLLDTLGISQPVWSRVGSIEGARRFARSIGYPVLVRPSYVLSGAAMNVALDERGLVTYIRRASKISRRYPVVVSKFLTRAREVEVDGVSDGRHVFIGALVEHVENAGVHSGDATMSIPTLTLNDLVKEKLLDLVHKIAKELEIRGPFNIQFIVKNDQVFVIECNLRASRSMPFVSKAIGRNLMEIAARAVTGGDVEEGLGVPRSFAVKAPQFSFTRLDNADPVTGVEMVSTGEVACFGETFEDAFVKALVASNFYVPKPGDAVLLTMGETRKELLPYARMLVQGGYKLFATHHTWEEMRANGVDCAILHKVSEKRKPNILDYLVSQEIKLVINIPSPQQSKSRRILKDEYLIRRRAAEFGIPVVTNLQLAKTLVKALVRRTGRETSRRPIIRTARGPSELGSQRPDSSLEKTTAIAVAPQT